MKENINTNNQMERNHLQLRSQQQPRVFAKDLANIMNNKGPGHLLGTSQVTEKAQLTKSVVQMVGSTIEGAKN